MPPNMPHKCSAPNCNQRFEQEKSLIKHKASAHSKPAQHKQTAQQVISINDIKPYNCNKLGCGRRFKDREALAKHMAASHPAQILPPIVVPQPSPLPSPAYPTTLPNVDARDGRYNSVGGSQYHINTMFVGAADFPANLVGMPPTQPPPYQ